MGFFDISFDSFLAYRAYRFGSTYQLRRQESTIAKEIKLFKKLSLE